MPIVWTPAQARQGVGDDGTIKLIRKPDNGDGKLIGEFSGTDTPSANDKATFARDIGRQALQVAAIRTYLR